MFWLLRYQLCHVQRHVPISRLVRNVTHSKAGQAVRYEIYDTALHRTPPPAHHRPSAPPTLCSPTARERLATETTGSWRRKPWRICMWGSEVGRHGPRHVSCRERDILRRRWTRHPLPSVLLCRLLLSSHGLHRARPFYLIQNSNLTWLACAGA
jgi:hypothetical protein